jgi:hypothetical protein
MFDRGMHRSLFKEEQTKASKISHPIRILHGFGTDEETG